MPKKEVMKKRADTKNASVTQRSSQEGLERGSGSVEVFGGFVPFFFSFFFFNHSHSEQAQEPNLRPKRVRAALPTSSKQIFPRRAEGPRLDSYKPAILRKGITLNK